MLDRGDVARAGETREVLEAYRMFANDHGWLAKMREVIATGVTAEAAVQRVQSDTSARMQRVADPILRERLYDLDDLANRLLRQLTGDGHHVDGATMPKDAILVARSMGPAALLDYDPGQLRGPRPGGGWPDQPCRHRRPCARHRRRRRGREHHQSRRAG